ncbi:hypothetical protein EJ03DRAFT_169318 [Teratosphaeria nubilosa]|uniref:Uncharacterized protein n=1 Tax=Teratosphaeria nubilosa TaxID=161662 RepID=A0A6G1LIP9_9PEZI|nr:hypothetical protein EJ03DRAFT_169318 [Teratosphaeria nubilosa]
MTRSKGMAKGKPSRPKPRVEYVAIGSDEAKAAAPRLRGALRGLNPNNVLSATSVQASTESPDAHVDENGQPLSPANTSGRALRHIKVDKEKYDMTFHILDEVTRPKRTAKRRSASGSMSRSIEPEADTDEESDLCSARSGDSEDDSDNASPPSRAHVSKPAPKMRSKYTKGVVSLADTSDLDDSVAQSIHESQSSPARLDRHIEVTDSDESTGLFDTADRSSLFTSSGLPPVTNETQAPDDGFQIGQTFPQPSTSTSPVLLFDDQEHGAELVMIKPYLYGYEPQHLTPSTQAVGRTNQSSATDVASSGAASSALGTHQGIMNAPKSRSEHTAAIQDIKIMESNERSTALPTTSNATLRQLSASSEVLADQPPSSYFEEALEVTESQTRPIEQPKARYLWAPARILVYWPAARSKACGCPLPKILTSEAVHDLKIGQRRDLASDM